MPTEPMPINEFIVDLEGQWFTNGLTKVSKYEDVIDKSQGPISKADFRKMYREGKIKFPK